MVNTRTQALDLHARGMFADAERAYRDILANENDDGVREAFGQLAMQTGRFDLAIQLFGEVLKSKPSASIHSWMGHAFAASSRFDEAARSYESARSLAPTDELTHMNLGNLMRAVGQWRQAVECYDMAIRLSPRLTDAHLARGDTLWQNGEPQRALEGYESLLQFEPRAQAALIRKAAVLSSLQRWSEALKSIDIAISLNGDFWQAHELRGQTLMHAGLLEDAHRSFGRAIELSPTVASNYVHRGRAAQALGRGADALKDLDHALSLDPRCFDAALSRAGVLIDLGRVDQVLDQLDRLRVVFPEQSQSIELQRAHALLAMNRFQEARVCYDRSIAANPSIPEAYIGRARALLWQGQFLDALADCDGALALAPRRKAGLAVRGLVLRQLKRLEEGIADLETAVSLPPEEYHTQFDLGCLHLSLGHYEVGWELYEHRPSLRRLHTAGSRASRWDGRQSLTGKTLLIFEDQGMGDTIHFSRFALLAVECGAQVTLSVRSGLRSLMQTLDPRITVVEANADGALNPAALTTFDFHCAVSSLPRAFAVRLGNVFAPKSYLAAEAARLARWHRVVGTESFRIGVCWQGAAAQFKVGEGLRPSEVPRTASVFDRSFPLSALQPLAALSGVRLISLQKGDGLDQLKTLPAGMAVETLGDEFDAGPQKLLDAAAVICQTDLVITCDTSIAHLAGALGRPAWVALQYVPDWRWLLDNSSSPWYPSLRLFRQGANREWGDVFAEMRDSLSAGDLRLESSQNRREDRGFFGYG